MSNKTSFINVREYFNLLAFFLFSLVTLYFSPEVIFGFTDAAAATQDAITTTLCTVVATLTGSMGKAISTIAIVVLGIGLFVGKLQWPVAIATAIGIGLIFGAANLVSWVGGSNATAASGCPTTT